MAKRKGPDTDASAPEETMAYEDALARLEETVAKLEAGTLPLEASLAAFDEGVGLIRMLGGRLDAMERRMLQLVEGHDGTQTVPLEEA